MASELIGMEIDPPQASEEFLDALTAINLRRIWIITVVGAVIAVAVFVSERLLRQRGNITEVPALDSLTSITMIFVVALVRRRPRRGVWPRWFVAGFALLWLTSMDVYYFTAFAAGAHNASYAIGVMSAAVLFLLPPSVFLPLLVINHVFYCVRLVALAPTAHVPLAAPLIDGTVSLAVAALAAWFLYHAARENFFKTRALAASNAELREVMAIAAHDLRSPLLDVRNLLGLARREPGANDGPLARVLTLATDSCSAMVHLVSRLVDAHAAEEAGPKLQLAPHDLRACCTAAVERLRATAEAKQQRIELVLPVEPATATIDAATLAQVLENLLGNALKFSPRESRVELALAKGHTHWSIEVRDEGPGVPEEERAQLFQKFQRGSARPTGGESSTGLGLHIVRTLTEAMGGRVGYTPRTPRGAAFRVELAA